jgi:hypothetical protein
MVASAVSSLDTIQSDFLNALPRIVRHARVYFRHLHCRHKKADFVSEVVAICWRWWLRLVERGRNPRTFVSTLATFAAKAVRCGRRLCGQLKAKDVLSERAQQRQNFSVSKLPDFSTESTNPLAEALADNTVSPVPDQVQFRLDFPAWTRSRCQRDRRLIHDMATGERTKVLAHRFKLSEARISQLRRDFYEDYDRFTAAPEEA